MWLVTADMALRGLLFRVWLQQQRAHGVNIQITPFRFRGKCQTAALN